MVQGSECNDMECNGVIDSHYSLHYRPSDFGHMDKNLAHLKETSVMRFCSLALRTVLFTSLTTYPILCHLSLNQHLKAKAPESIGLSSSGNM